MARILVVEDDRTTRGAIVNALKKMKVGSGLSPEVAQAASGPEALRLVAEQFFHLVITDLILQPTTHDTSSAGEAIDGLTVLDHVKTVSPDTVVVVLTGQGNIDSAVTALKRGAADYIEKPGSLPQIRGAVERILTEQRAALLERHARESAGSSGSRPAPGRRLVGAAPAWQAVMERVARAAEDGSITVLVRGETGTGKELVARAVHEGGPRASRPFVPINCVALPDELLETELFGYTKGAFTGADADKPGLLQAADGGTIFLDEIGDMPAHLQAKLLRVLQEREFSPVGQSQSIRVDVRVIAATNRNLEERLADGRFREDLFYRLNALTISLPPLRDRREDIPALTEYALDRFDREKSKSTRLAPETVAALGHYDWPGNVRELFNVIESVVTLIGNGLVQPEHLPERIIQTRVGDTTFRHEIRSHEREVLVAALERHDWNATRAARELGLSREAVQRKMKQLGINRPPRS